MFNLLGGKCQIYRRPVLLANFDEGIAVTEARICRSVNDEKFIESESYDSQDDRVGRTRGKTATN